MKLVIIVLLLAAMVGAQEVKHAPPTIEQCRADGKIWSVQSFEVADRVSVSTLKDRWKEMHDCERVDSDPDQQCAYYKAMYHIVIQEEVRLESFIRHHGLWDQFYADDAAGKR